MGRHQDVDTASIGITGRVLEARAAPGEKKSSSQWDMNLLIAKSAKGRKSSARGRKDSVEVRRSGSIWRSGRLRSRRCSQTVTATSLDMLVRSRVPSGPRMRSSEVSKFLGIMLPSMPPTSWLP